MILSEERYHPSKGFLGKYFYSKYFNNVIRCRLYRLQFKETLPSFPIFPNSIFGNFEKYLPLKGILWKLKGFGKAFLNLFNIQLAQNEWLGPINGPIQAVSIPSQTSTSKLDALVFKVDEYIYPW